VEENGSLNVSIKISSFVCLFGGNRSFSGMVMVA